MEMIQGIAFFDVLGAQYFMFFSVFLGILLYALVHERRADGTAPVFTACAGAACFYIARLIAVRAESGAPGTAEGSWPVAAGIFNALGMLSAALASRRIAAAEPDPVELDQADAEQSGTCGNAHLFAHGALAGVAGAGIYAALAYAGMLPFMIAYLAGAVCAAVVARLLWMCARSVAQSRTEARGQVIGAMITMALAWAVFHAVLTFHLQGHAALRALSRLLDCAALFAVLHCLLTRRTLQRLRFRHHAIFNRRKALETRDELGRLTKLSSQIYEDNSDLIRKLKAQAKQFMQKSENLENTLQVGLEIQKKRDLRDLLQRIVELVRDNLGFETVVLRLLIEKTQSFESRAYVGVNEDMEEVVVNYRIPKSEFNKMIEPHFRISRSYFIRNSSSWPGDSIQNYQTLEGGDAWREINMLIVPMQDEDEKILGYLSVENPKATDMPVADVIENLESIASLAVTAIKNANLFTELEEKNEKLKLYAEKLESLNKMKSNFVSTISHEFKTPLTSIKAYCETLINNADNVDKMIIKEFLMVIDDESNRLMALIEDILNFSRMESGAMKFERVQCSLNTVLQCAVKDLEPNFTRKNITVSLAMPEKDVVIRADNEMMKQLGLNLLHNAAKFTPERGSVRVSLEDETVSAKIIIEDDGGGIPEDQMEQIFEHFHQVDNSNTRKHGGSGLGLALCQNIAEWHDGKIWVENVHGGGARFIVILPKKQVVVRNQTAGLSGVVRRFEVERYLELLIEMVAELLAVKRASIMLFDVSKSELRIESAIGIDEEIVESARVKLGDSISGRVVAEGRTYLVEDIEQDPRTFRCNNEYLYESKSFLSVPIKIQGEVVGVVNVANPVKKRTFDEEDRGLLEMFVERIAHALQKLEEFTHVSEDFEKIRETMKSIMDAKRFISLKNEMDIPALVIRTADKLKLNQEEKATLQYALNIYDVGLVKIGYHIIKKPKELTPDERDKIKDHTILGLEMLKTIEAMPRVKDIVLYHHENFDGSGYPGRLSGKAIPIGARIIRVVDSFRALISNRPYQKPYSVEEAIEVLKHRINTFYDPDVVQAFIEAVREEKSKSESNSDSKSHTAENKQQTAGAAAPKLEEETNAQR